MNIYLIVFFIIILFIPSCKKEALVWKDNVEKESPRYYDNLYKKTKTKKEKLKLLERLTHSIRPETSIVLIRAFFEPDMEIVEKAHEVLNEYRRFHYDKTENYFYTSLGSWWSKEDEVILEQMGYTESYEKFIEEEKKGGREIWQYKENPLYFLFQKNLYKEEIVNLLYDEDPYRIEKHKVNQIYEEEIKLSFIEEDGVKNKADPLTKIKLKKQKKKKINLIERKKNIIQQQLRYFWSLYLISHFKNEETLPILIQYLIVYHLNKKEQKKNLYQGYIKHWKENIKKVNPKFKDDPHLFYDKHQSPKKHNINYEWMSLYAVSQFRDPKWKTFLAHWLLKEDNPYIQELIVAYLGQFYIQDYHDLLTQFYYSMDPKISLPMRYAILWSLARVQDKNLIHFLTQKNPGKAKPLQAKKNEETNFFIDWLNIQKLFWIKNFKWIFPPKIVFDHLNLKKDKAKKLQNTIAIHLALDILDQEEHFVLLRDNKLQEDNPRKDLPKQAIQLARQQILNSLYPFLKLDFFVHHSYIKKLVKLIYKYQEFSEDTRVYDQLKTYLEGLLDLEQKLLSVKGKLPSEWVLKKRKEFQIQIFEYLMIIDQKRCIQDFEYLLEPNMLYQHLTFYWIKNIYEYKKSSYFLSILNFYQKLYPNSKKNKEGFKYDKGYVFPLHKILIQFATLKDINQLLLKEGLHEYFQNAVIRALWVHLDSIKNWDLILELYDKGKSAKFKLALIEFLGKVKYIKAEDFIFQIAFNKQSSLAYKSTAWKALSFFPKKKNHLEKLLAYFLTLRDKKERMAILKTLQHFLEYKNEILKWFRDLLEKKLHHQESFFILIMCIYFENMRYEDWLLLVKILELDNNQDYYLIFKEQFFNKLEVTAANQWTIYLLKSCPLGFREFLHSFFFPISKLEKIASE